MKIRQRKKIFKRSGNKLTSLEQRACDIEVESKVSSALCKFNNKEFEAGTIYKDGYMTRLTKVFTDAASIENVTGVTRTVD